MTPFVRCRRRRLVNARDETATDHDDRAKKIIYGLCGVSQTACGDLLHRDTRRCHRHHHHHRQQQQEKEEKLYKFKEKKDSQALLLLK